MMEFDHPLFFHPASDLLRILILLKIAVDEPFDFRCQFDGFELAFITLFSPPVGLPVSLLSAIAADLP
jgi:hypothetical protein